MKKLFRKSHPYLLLFVVVIVGYWQVSFFASALKWDLIDVVFPFRYHFSECIQSGYFPFWNPYLQTGTPFFADLQAPTFYPELLFTSLFSGYGIYTMHILFVMYVFIAALGMYRLSFHFNKNRNASLFAGVAYAFSGFIIGHGQHFFLLVGAAWIPFVLVNYLQLIQNQSFVNVLKTGVFVLLMISGAYQALSFTLMYLLLVVFLYFLGVELKKKRFSVALDLIKTNLFLLFVIVIFSLPLVVSTLEILSSVDRLEGGVDIVQSVSSGLSLKSVISFVFPFSTLKYGAFFGGADLSMRNHYFGLIPLLFFALALLKRRTIVEYIILGFGLIIFASSLSFFPVRDLMFRFVPFMNLFKYAAYLRVFGLLAFILMAANYFTYFQGNVEKEQNKLKALIIVFLIGIIAIIVYSVGKLEAGQVKSFGDLPFYGHVLVQATIQFIVLFLLFIILIFRGKIKYVFHFVLLLFIAEILLASQLNMSATVTDEENKPFQLANNLELMPKRFPIPFDSKIKYNDGTRDLPTPFWRNTANFTKQVSFKSFSSFELKSFNKLDDDYPNLKNATLNNHLFYFSDKIFPLSKFNDDDINEVAHSSHLFLPEEDYQNLKPETVSMNKQDKFEIIEFSPNKVVVSTNTNNPQFLTMLQTNFKGWKAFLDKKETPIYTSNFNYKTIVLPEGEHTVVYEYKNNKILVLYIFSNLLFLLTVLFLFGRFLYKKYPTRKFHYLFPILLVFLFSMLLARILVNQTDNKNTYEILSENWDIEKSEINTKINDRIIIEESSEYINLASINSKDIKNKRGTLIVKAKLFPFDYSEALIVSDIPGRQKSAWNALKLEKQIEKPMTWNDIIYQCNIFDLSAEEQIKVYFWNNKKNHFKLDSVSVEFYPFK